MNTLRLVLGDQLNPRHPWFEQIDPDVLYVLMEIRQETDYVLHHAQKILAIFAGMRELARGLAEGPIPRTEAAFDAALAAARRIGDPTLQDIGDPQARIAAESLQQRVREIRDAVGAEIGAALGIAAGFNSLDGD